VRHVQTRVDDDVLLAKHLVRRWYYYYVRTYVIDVLEHACECFRWHLRSLRPKSLLLLFASLYCFPDHAYISYAHWPRPAWSVRSTWFPTPLIDPIMQRYRSAARHNIPTILHESAPWLDASTSFRFFFFLFPPKTKCLIILICCSRPPNHFVTLARCKKVR